MTDPLMPPGRVSMEIDIAALRQLGMKELHDFRDVMHTVNEVLSAFQNQPRFQASDHEYKLNKAGDLLDDLTELVSGLEQAAVNVAKASKPIEPDSVDWRNWTILGFEADMADDLPIFAVRAAEAVRDGSEADFRARHKRGAA